MHEDTHIWFTLMIHFKFTFTLSIPEFCWLCEDNCIVSGPNWVGVRWETKVQKPWCHGRKLQGCIVICSDTTDLQKPSGPTANLCGKCRALVLQKGGYLRQKKTTKEIDRSNICSPVRVSSQSDTIFGLASALTPAACLSSPTCLNSYPAQLQRV